jgi:hypothetical protein
VSPNTAAVTGDLWLIRRLSAGDLNFGSLVNLKLADAGFLYNKGAKFRDNLKWTADTVCVTDSRGSGKHQVAVSCENGNETSGSIKRSEFIT